MNSHKLLTLGFLSIIFLFFLQLSTRLIEAIYTLNLLGSGLNPYAAGIVWMLFSGLLFLFRKPGIYRRFSQICLGIFLLSRILIPFMPSRPTIFVAGLGVASFLLFYPLYLFQLKKDHHMKLGYLHGLSFAFATLLSILLRTLGASLDLSFLGWYQVIGWVLSVFCVWILIDYEKILPSIATVESSTPIENPKSAEQIKKDKRRAFGASFGFLNLFVLVVFGFESPTVFARWTEGNYAVINILLTAVIGGFIIITLVKPGLINKLPSWVLWVWNLVFTGLIVLTILVHTIQFPPTPGSPVVVVGNPFWYQQIPLYLMVITSPIIYLDMILISSQLIRSSPTLPSVAGGFMLGGFYFIILIFMSIFTNVWGYIKPISNLFRNLYWLPFLLIGLVMVLGVVVIKLKDHPFTNLIFSKPTKYASNTIVAACLIGIIVSTFIIAPHPQQIDSTPITTLTVMTYNVQQGNNQTAEKNYDAQLEIIRKSGADIIALQETDTARIGLGNSDLVRYFATKLGYYSYYGPKTVTGTYGTAILSRFPIIHGESIFSYSNKDETGTAYAIIDINGMHFNVFCSHPDGNFDNHWDHMQAIITKINTDSLTRVISMGDFNTRQYSEFYNLSVSVLTDVWLAVYPTGIDSLSQNMTQRIDHIFISPDLTPDNAWCIPEGPSQSDHNVFWATLSW